jgi:hypothetical protein
MAPCPASTFPCISGAFLFFHTENPKDGALMDQPIIFKSIEGEAEGQFVTINAVVFTNRKSGAGDVGIPETENPITKCPANEGQAALRQSAGEPLCSVRFNNTRARFAGRRGH